MNKPFSYEFNENDHLIGIRPFSGGLIKISIDLFEYYEMKTFKNGSNGYGLKMYSTKDDQLETCLLPKFSSYKKITDEILKDMYGSELSKEQISAFLKTISEGDDGWEKYSPIYVYEHNGVYFINRYVVQLIAKFIGNRKIGGKANADKRINNETNNTGEYKDCLGNILHKGDYCARIYGKAEIGLAHIVKTNKQTVEFSIWPYRTAYSKIISLSAFGIEGEDKGLYSPGKGIAIEIKEGDVVLYATDYSSFKTDTVEKVTEMKVRFDNNGVRSYKDKCSILDLTALGIDKRVVDLLK